MMLFVVAVAVLAIVAFAKEWWSHDSTALMILLVLVAGGALPAREAFQAFGNEALVTVAAMFVLSAALTRTGAVERVGREIVRLGGGSEPRILLALMLACMGCSAFINNTPIAVVFLPIVLGIAQSTGIAGSKLLIPMSYATIVGGMTTIIGTSTNVLVSARLPDHGIEPFSLFAPLPIALVGCALTLLYMLLVGRRLLPSNTTVSDVARSGKVADYLTEIRLPIDSPLAGQDVATAFFARAPSLRVLQIVRGEAILQPRAAGVKLAGGDTLLAKADADALRAIQTLPGVLVGGEAAAGARGRETTLAELLVRPTSGVIGARVGDLKLYAAHGVAVLAVQRDGTHVREKVVDITLRLGDVLLVQGGTEALEAFRGSQDFVLLEGVAERVVLREKAWLAVAVVAAVIVIAAVGWMPISYLTIAGCLVVVAGGCLTAREAYRGIDLPLLVLMAGTIGLGRALETSGAAVSAAQALVHVAEPLGDVAVLGAVYLITNVCTAFISNAAAALMVLPIGIAVAVQTGMHPEPFVMAVMFAASIDFSTPIGYQTNTFVYGPGGYRFLDYVKVGTPLNLIWWLLCTALIPVFWPLR
jgi:di/tricarboxylate transporter